MYINPKFQYAELKRLTSDVHPTLDYVSMIRLNVILKPSFHNIYSVFSCVHTHNFQQQQQQKMVLPAVFIDLDQLLPFS